MKRCTACHLVRYCGIQCQKDHWRKHKRACKKRAAELRDELLFKQPESTHLGDCPICMVPMPLYPSYACCSKIVCNGCIYAMERENTKKRANVHSVEKRWPTQPVEQINKE